MSDLRETLDELKERVEDTEDARDAVVSTNSVAIGDVPVKTAYSKNITIEEWNQLVEDMKALLSNATADRGLATELASAAGILADSILDVVSTCLPLSGGSITGDLSVGGNLTIANSEITDGTYVWTFPSKYGTVAMESDVSALRTEITSGTITAQKARRDGNGNVIIDTYIRKADVVDNLASTATNKPLSANQGKALGDRLTVAEGDIDGLETAKADITYVDGLVASVKANAFQVAQTLPQTGEEGVIYLVPVQGEDYYTQYIWEGNSWLGIGDTQIDLSGYLPLTGGTITGDLSIDGSVYLNGIDLESELSEKADKASYYGTLGAGYADVAKELETSIGITQETPFSFNTVGGKSDVSTGEHRLDGLTGVSVVDNQLLRNGDFSDGATDWLNESAAGTLSVSNGIATWTRTGGEGAFLILYQAAAKFETNTSHKYLVAFRAKASANGIKIRLATSDPYLDFTLSTSWQTYLAVITPRSNIRYFCLNNVTGGPEIGDSIDFDFVNCKSLTQRYGNSTVVNAILGNDSSKYVERLLKFDPNILKQIAFNAGTFVDSQSAKLKSVGYNIFDGEFTQSASGTQLYSKNKMPVVVGQTYTFETLAFTQWSGLYIREYDFNDNQIKQNSFYTVSTKKYDFTPSLNASYIKFELYNPTPITDNHPQLCIHLKWDGSRTGYEPYESYTYDLPNLVQRGILKVDGDGNVYADGDVAYPDGTGETRYGIVDLGTLNYTKGSNGRMITDGLSSLIDRSTGYYRVPPLVCARYTATMLANIEAANPPDKSISVGGNTYSICIYDSAYTDAATFKAAMSGVYLVYKLATPIAITFDPFAPNIYGDDFGTFQALDEDGNEANLQGFSIFYRANIAGFAESVYARDDIDGDPAQLVSHTELSASVYTKAQADARFALKEALGGTLRQVLAVKANIEFSNTEYKALGDTTWVYLNDRFVSPTNTVPGALYTSKNAVCTSYALSPNWYNSGMPDKTIFFTEEGRIVVHDSAYTDPTEFQNAMKGVLLAYEKAS